MSTCNTPTVTLIVPYFGKLPDHFQFWLQTCGNNTEFQWLIFTDDLRDFNYPQNVHRITMSLETLKTRFEITLGFSVALFRPYKLCDFKPLYGVLFSEYLQDSQYWGYSDVDLLFGQLSNFITSSDLITYDKISVLGHLSIFKNIEKINHAFELCDYQEILQDARSRVFDEFRFEPNINSIMREAGFKVKVAIPYADIDFQHYSFGLHQYISGNRSQSLPRYPLIFEYNDGEVIGLELRGNKIVETEYAYVHFQKRNIRLCAEMGVKRFLLVPNKICEYEPITSELIYRYGKDSMSYTMKNCWKRIKNAIKTRIPSK